MNRIILIGNGFDLAHGLPTGYKDFINNYWKKFVQNFSRYIIYPFEEDFVKFNWDNGQPSYCTHGLNPNHFFLKVQEIESYDDLKQLIADFNDASDLKLNLSFKNKFFEHISEMTCLNTWLDIENEYYILLKDFLKKSRQYAKEWPTVKNLNDEFCQVKELLEKYLTDVCKKEVKPQKYILTNIIIAGIKYKDVAISERKTFLDVIPKEKENQLKMVNDFVKKENEQSAQKQVQAMLTGTPYIKQPLCEMDEKESELECEQSIKESGINTPHTLMLNFNYTDTVEKLFGKPDDKYDWDDYRRAERPLLDIINIHGELNSKSNPIIFGYGDELADEYKEIEKLNNNEYLKNVKSINYLKTDNYRKLLDFIDTDCYQISILGHSCGNSDRTLLNTLFNHKNCVSIKPFYRKKADGTDNYEEIIMNISRNFNDKKTFREKVVNKTYCEPLQQIAQQV